MELIAPGSYRTIYWKPVSLEKNLSVCLLDNAVRMRLFSLLDTIPDPYDDNDLYDAFQTKELVVHGIVQEDWEYIFGYWYRKTGSCLHVNYKSSAQWVARLALNTMFDIEL